MGLLFVTSQSSSSAVPATTPSGQLPTRLTVPALVGELLEQRQQPGAVAQARRCERTTVVGRSHRRLQVSQDIRDSDRQPTTPGEDAGQDWDRQRLSIGPLGQRQR